MKTAHEVRVRRSTLRASPTSAEATLWNALVERWPNKKRRKRQIIIGYYIADFAFPHRCLIVEVDGPIHGLQQAHDARRDAFLRECGFTVLRFTNAEVVFSTQAVIDAICAVPARDYPLSWQMALGKAGFRAQRGRENAVRERRRRRLSAS